MDADDPLVRDLEHHQRVGLEGARPSVGAPYRYGRRAVCRDRDDSVTAAFVLLAATLLLLFGVPAKAPAVAAPVPSRT